MSGLTATRCHILDSKGYHLTLNEEQQSVVDVIERDLNQKIAKTYLIKGVTGSARRRCTWN